MTAGASAATRACRDSMSMIVRHTGGQGHETYQNTKTNDDSVLPSIVRARRPLPLACSRTVVVTERARAVVRTRPEVVHLVPSPTLELVARRVKAAVVCGLLASQDIVGVRDRLKTRVSDRRWQGTTMRRVGMVGADKFVVFMPFESTTRK